MDGRIPTWPNHLKPNFLIATCRSCSNHKWNTRHDEERYMQVAIELKEAIEELIPELSK